jgi:hypothetical protein
MKAEGRKKNRRKDDCLLGCCDVSEVFAASETSVNFYEATRRNIPEDSHLHTRRRENLKPRSKRKKKAKRKEKRERGKEDGGTER